MTFKILWKMIKQNFVNQRHIIVPFISVISILFGIEYILLSLTTNIYFNEHHPELKISAMIGIVFMTMLLFIFLIYANHFVMNRRKKEFALNMVLGMEKKHLRLIILIELLIQFIISAILSIVGGYLFGELFFMLFNKLVNTHQPQLSDYPFDVLSMKITLTMLFSLMIILFVINNFKISFKNSLQLLLKNKSKTHEKSRVLLIIFLILGLIFIGMGYYLAIKPNTAIGSLGIIFFAILSTLIGTYLLFVSLGSIVLEMLQKLDHYYYKPNHFFFIAGLKSRVKSSAIGLATISFMCTFLIVTLSMTVSTYRNMDHRFEFAFKNDYAGYYIGDFHKNSKIQRKIENLKKDIRQEVPTGQFKIYARGMVGAELQGGLKHKKLKRQTVSSGLFNFGNKRKFNSFISIYNKSDYNKKIKLNDDEIAISTSVSLFKKMKTLNIFGKTYRVKYIESTNMDNLLYADGITLIVNQQQLMDRIVNEYRNHNDENLIITPNQVQTAVEFNVLKEKDKLNHRIKKIGVQHDIEFQVKKQNLLMWKQVNSSLVFVGSVVSLVLLIGIFLMMYYKQVSEGHEDRDAYITMKQLGLDENLIKKTINKQVIWVFLIPVIVAIIHTLAAFRIIYSVLGIVGQYDLGLYATSYVGVIVVFIIFYSMMYWITSRIYYTMINGKH
ncbi:bacitracin transport system permease protein [Staphylococcus epidermidis]|uniref:FtsX-like permease family protein n=1 Tax=Staphylococcus epidermidis TaxID=1282 RepID=UPI00209246E2|nr:FtsX-like permease family protein [Staphylococcus epidermidis]MCO6291761.1 FtsX-like permease family protein [Staphylococcus epidermidis]MDS3947050.1 FtsX-like permease family protein [Staphylococcus epidermidis]